MPTPARRAAGSHRTGERIYLSFKLILNSKVGCVEMASAVSDVIELVSLEPSYLLC